jgi:hypothetical protein
MSAADATESWRAVGRTAGYVSGLALLLGTIFYLLDATNALGVNHYHSRGAPSVQNESGFWVSQFAHQHHILWDIIARDTLFPIAFVALVVLSLAVRAFVRADRPNAQLMVAFFLIGGILSALADLIYLGATDYWRLTGWPNVPAVSMVAVGRSEAAIEALTRWPEAAGFVVLAAALVCLGNLCRSEAALPTRLALLSYLEGALLVGLALAGVMETGTPYDILSLIAGAIVGPSLAFWFGWHLGSSRSVRPTA